MAPFNRRLMHAVCMTLAVIPRYVDAQQLYTTTDLANAYSESCEPSYVPLLGSAINNRGDVAGKIPAVCGTSFGVDFIYSRATGKVTRIEAKSTPPTAINASDTVTGYSIAAGGFVYQNGQATFIEPPSGVRSSSLTVMPSDLNSKGTVFGTYQDFGVTSGNGNHAFMWNNGIMTDLDPVLGGQGSTASAINYRGDIVGASVADGPYLLRSTGHLVKLRNTSQSIPPQSHIAGANGNVWTVKGGKIYKNGTVDPVTANVILLLYYNGVIYQENSTPTWYQLVSTQWPAELCHCGGGGSGYSVIAGNPSLGSLVPVAMNNFDEVTGCYWNSGPTAFLWLNQRTWFLGTLAGASGNSCASAINDNGEIVGNLTDSAGNPSGAFIWDGEMHDLNTLILPSDPLYGSVHLDSASGVNDKGEILVGATYTGTTNTGAQTTLILDPVPPAQVTMVVQQPR